MVMWSVLRNRLVVICLVAVAAIASAAGFGLGWKLGAASQMAATLAAQAKLTDSETARAKGWESAAAWYGTANQRAIEAEQKARDIGIRAGEARKQYEQQRKDNPSCAAQDAQPLLCQPW